jgi:flagellar hook-length control protein FliK
MTSTTVNSVISLYGLSEAGNTDLSASGSGSGDGNFAQVLKQIGVAADTGHKDAGALETAGNTRTDSSVATKTGPNGNNGNVTRDSQNRAQSSNKADDSGSDSKNVRDDDKTAGNDDTKTETGSTKTGSKDTKTAAKTDTKTDTKTEAKTAASDVSAEDDTVSEKVSEKLQELIQMIADQMGLTKEQVTDAMEKMGMTAVQLLMPENMAKLTVSLSGNEDNMSALLTDEKLYTNLNTLQKNAEETLKSISGDLGVSEDQLKQMIADAASAQKETVQTATSGTALKAGTDAAGSQTAEALTGMQDYVSRTSVSGGKQLEIKVTVDDRSGQKTFDATEQIVNAVKKGETSSNDMTGSQEGFAQNSAQSFAENLNSLITETANAAAQTETAKAVQTQNIYDQIADYMKIQLKPETTSLEIQLHPANLGTVNVHLTEKQGMLTAEFTTQNEAVKAAVESQIVQLKNQFEEQGIKVEAVEVSVAEQKYSQNGRENSDKSEQTDQGGKVRSRRINLNDSGESEEGTELDDSDTIVADMMARNGNKIDYTA